MKGADYGCGYLAVEWLSKGGSRENTMLNSEFQ